MLDSKNIEALQTLQIQGKLDEGLALVEKILPEAKEDPNFWNYFGIFLADRNFLFGALAAYFRALELPNPSNYVYTNIGNIYTRLQWFSEANIFYQLAIEKDPNLVLFYRNYWVSLFDNRQMDKAFEVAQKAIELEPTNYSSLFRLGQCYLVTGNYKKAWPLFENRRFVFPDHFANIPNLPRWQGESLEGKTLLLRSEQGYGDRLLFSRFIPLIKKKNTKIILMVPLPLIVLFNKIPGVDVLIPYDSHCKFFPPGDYYLDLMSLAHVLNINNLESIPPPPPLYIPEKSKNKIMTTVRSYQNRFKIGIAWTGNPKDTANSLKSIPLDFFLQLLEVPGVELFNFQKDTAAIIEASPLKFFLRNIETYFDDFADTAAAIEAMDLMITIDTATAHLAGSLGKPAWVLLHNSSYWVWLDKRTDSPWYPSVRLYRQKTPGNWIEVFNEVIKDLATFCSR